jgi:DNA-binding transcriptional ArsR family regulator
MDRHAGGSNLHGVHQSLPGFRMPDQAEVTAAVDAFRMLADPTRVKILWALMQGESSVACLAELAEVTPTAASQHLAKLRLGGLVKGRREGTFVYYAPADRDVCDLLKVILGEGEPVAG